MGERRLTIRGYLGAWAALVALQSLALFGPLAELSPGLRVAWVALWQLAKVVPTAWRLNDLGADPSSAPLFALVPIANVAAFFGRMLERTPSEALRARRRAQWQGSIGALAALGRGLGLVGATLPLGLPLVLIYAVLSTLGARWALGRLDWALALGPGNLGGLTSALGVFTGFLALYTLLQTFKLRRASRVSWAPSLLLAPALLALGGLTLVDRGMGSELGPAVLTLFLIAWNLAFASFAGAALAVAHVLLGDAALRGETLGARELLGQVGRRTLDVSAPHGARVHAVSIGIQLLVPGVFYALQLAFTDLIAVLEPNQRALSRSSQLTRGMRMRLFKVFLVWALVSAGLTFAVAYVLQPAEFAASFFDPRVLTTPTYLMQEIVWALTSWVLQMALLVLYVERVAREDARKAAAPAPSAEVLGAAEAAR